MDEEIVLCLPQDINKFCRTCMALTEDILPQNIVLVEDNKPTLAAEMLESCTFAQIHADDELPKSICIECTQKLEIAYNYKLQCEQTDKNLREILNLTAETSTKAKDNAAVRCSEPLARNPERVKGVVLYENVSATNFIDTSVECAEESALKLEALVEDNRKRLANMSPVPASVTDTSSQLEIRALIEERKSAVYVGHVTEPGLNSNEVAPATGFESDPEIKTELLSGDEEAAGGEHVCTGCGVSCGSGEDLVQHVPECEGHKLVLAKLLKLEAEPVTAAAGEADTLPPFACPVCGVYFKSVQARNGHLATHRTNGERAGFRCDLCGKGYTTEAKLATHFQRHAAKRDEGPEDGGELQCDRCRATFRDETKLVRHMRKHGVHLSLCKVCRRRFETPAQLREHMKTHWTNVGGHKYRCPICEQHFPSAGTLKSHAAVHVHDSHDCGRCKRSFGNKFAFEKHMKQHTEPRFLCALCGKQYFSSVTLACHIRSHNNEKPFVCQFCAKAFSSRATLSVHKRIHSAFKPYVCSYCGYSCRQSGDLAMHVRTHTGVKPYKCTFPNCERKFTTSSQRKEHYRRHTNERNHKCPECQKAFLESKTLKVHMLTHTGEKPHCCDVCGKKFRRTHHLVNHMKGHK